MKLPSQVLLGIVLFVLFTTNYILRYIYIYKEIFIAKVEIDLNVQVCVVCTTQTTTMCK